MTSRNKVNIGYFLMALGAALMIFAVFSSAAKSDSLVCRDAGGFQIYIETDNNETAVDPTLKEMGALRVEWVTMGTSYSRIQFHNGEGEWRISFIIPCTMIKEQVNETSSLRKFIALTITEKIK